MRNYKCKSIFIEIDGHVLKVNTLKVDIDSVNMFSLLDGFNLALMNVH